MRAIGPPLTAEESAAFIAAARACKGVRFRHQGRNPKIGLDCAGLPQYAMSTLGRGVFDLKAYGREPHKNGLRMAMVENFGAPVPRESMRAGDVVLMRFEGHAEPRHVAILTDHPEGLGCLHVHSEMKFVSEHKLDARWAGFITEVFRP
jgi:cell wall-associated NlpC family hydrolase